MPTPTIEPGSPDLREVSPRGFQVRRIRRRKQACPQPHTAYQRAKSCARTTRQAWGKRHPASCRRFATTQQHRRSIRPILSVPVKIFGNSQADKRGPRPILSQYTCRGAVIHRRPAPQAGSDQGRKRPSSAPIQELSAELLLKNIRIGSIVAQSTSHQHKECSAMKCHCLVYGSPE